MFDKTQFLIGVWALTSVQQTHLENETARIEYVFFKTIPMKAEVLKVEHGSKPSMEHFM